MTRVPTYEARCDVCGFTFDIPMLPDISYGEFIAYGHDRKTHAYLDAFSHAAWDRIRELEAQAAPNETNPQRKAERFQWIVERCLDPIGSVQMSIVDGPACPACGSRYVWYGKNDQAEFVELPEVSFRVFMALAYAEQKKRVALLVKEWEQRAIANAESA